MPISLFATLAAAAMVTAAPAPAARHDLETLLAKPVSPGVIALLLPHTGDTRAAARVMEALAHEDAAVRAAAARVAGVAPLLSAGLAVRRALDSETDRSAAAEQLRASVLLLSAGDDLSLVLAARTHGLVDLLAETVANARGPLALPLLDPLVEAGLQEHREAVFIASATYGGRERLNVIGAAALRTKDTSRWSAVLSLARQPGADFAPGLLLAALGSQDSSIRAAVYWHLALTVAKGTPLSPELEGAVAATAEAASPESADVDAAFALTVLRRAQQGTGFGGDWGTRVASGTGKVPYDPWGQPEKIARFLTKAEATTLSRRLTRGNSDTMFELGTQTPATAEPADGLYGGLLFAGGLPPGMLRDILAVTGCKPSANLRVAALVDYRGDGRPRQISFTNDPLSPACADAARPALGLTLAPPGLVDPARRDRRTLVIVPLNEEALECADQPEPATAERVSSVDPGSPGKIKEPRKVKNVAPWYPPRAMAARTQGAVVVEAVIAPSGCVRSVRVARSVSPELDSSAMIAVGQWRYTPTLLDGKPVPVIMAVTVNFKLN